VSVGKDETHKSYIILVLEIDRLTFYIRKHEKEDNRFYSWAVDAFRYMVTFDGSFQQAIPP